MTATVWAQNAPGCVILVAPGGFDCPGCAWPDDPSGLRLDVCENGVKHATWELAPAKADREFFAAQTVGELAGWSDYDLGPTMTSATRSPPRRYARASTSSPGYRRHS